ncbi:hypothetical protein ACFL6S_27755 [Candidatus Poribacteria bacterium]
MSVFSAMLTIHLTLMAAWVPGSADAVPTMDTADREILAAYLEHVESSARYCTPERLAEFANQPEDITWQASQYIKMPLIAHKLTAETKYLDMFVERMDNLYGCLEQGADGFMGWYGVPLDLFRHPEYPDRQVDVMLTSFEVSGLMADFVQVVQNNEALKERYSETAQRYLALVEDHLIKKWDARGRYKDLGEAGAVYITHADLKPVKASLTQPHNKHSKIIQALLSVYAATGKDEYLVKAIKLGTRFKRCLTLADGRYQWNYWDPAGEWDIDPENPSRWKHWIGAEHRSGYYSSSLSQAVVLYENELIFSRTDIDRFVKTQTEVCWNGDLDNPKWARVDGKPSESSYLCSWLAPFDESVYKMAYGESAQRRRLEAKDHSWQGGPVASGYLEFKHLIYPRWKSEEPSENAATQFLSSYQENREWLMRLAFQVEEPGYKAPMSPAQMKAISDSQR